MERLTEYTDHGILLRKDVDIKIGSPEDFDNLQHVLSVLASYEDTGLTPVEIREIISSYHAVCKAHGINGH